MRCLRPCCFFFSSRRRHTRLQGDWSSDVWSSDLFAGLLAYGLLGTSRFAIVSATSSSAAVLLAATASMAGTSPQQRMLLGVGIVLLTGLFFVVAGLARLGAVSNFIAQALLRG